MLRHTPPGIEGFDLRFQGIQARVFNARVHYDFAVPGVPLTIELKAAVSRSDLEDVQRRERDAARRDDLIAFAKTGAPPALAVEGNVSDLGDLSGVKDALRSREESFSDDVMPESYVPVAPRELYMSECDIARASARVTRAVPRLRESKPWLELKPGMHICVDGSGNRLTTGKRYEITGFKNGYALLANDDKGTGRSGGWYMSRFRPVPVYKRPESLNDFAKEVHAANQHWWHDPSTGQTLDRNMGEMLMLVVSEIAECMEGERKDLMDDHLPHRKMAEVELADAIIRIADIAGAVLFDLDSFLRFLEVSNSRHSNWLRVADNKGETLLRIVAHLMRAYDVQDDHESMRRKFGCAIYLIEQYAEKHGYDLWGAVAEKREYNKHRADHKPEARLAANGKKF